METLGALVSLVSIKDHTEGGVEQVWAYQTHTRVPELWLAENPRYLSCPELLAYTSWLGMRRGMLEGHRDNLRQGCTVGLGSPGWPGRFKLGHKFGNG